MARDAASERVLFQLRAVLRGISPLIWRRLLVPSDTSIAQLHDVLQVAFGWEDMHLHRYEIRGREYGLSREGGVSFDTDARKVRIGDLKLDGLPRLSACCDARPRTLLSANFGNQLQLRTLVVAGMQRTRNRISDIAADERFAKHILQPARVRLAACYCSRSSE